MLALWQGGAFVGRRCPKNTTPDDRTLIPRVELSLHSLVPQERSTVVPPRRRKSAGGDFQIERGTNAHRSRGGGTNLSGRMETREMNTRSVFDPNGK